MLLRTTMFPNISTIITSASSYFYLPVDEDAEDSDDSLDLERVPRHISWSSSDSTEYEDSCFSSTSSSSSSSSIASDYTPSPPRPSKNRSLIKEILAEDDLYKVLGISRSTPVDRLILRRAYLSRSKACHPDKFPGSPQATEAFQKVTVAYDVLSKPAAKRMYDTNPSSSPYDFAAHPYQRAEETFRSVVLGVFNDFLEGDLETVRTLLRAVNDFNPSLRLGDDGIDAVLNALQSIRQRALTCRTCILTLNSELSRVLELQYAFRQLSYFDLRRRSRLTIELARIAISLPVALDRALQRQKVENTSGDPDWSREEGGQSKSPPRSNDTAILNRRLYRLLCGFAVVLERMEKLL
ncbi:unnamed protein product [Somion occarium]|uniref:J domain-containing protein n=1 Tax=Somion occarium TaxID=3059160 RepID=A0ABP1E8Q9_9APHY